MITEEQLEKACRAVAGYWEEATDTHWRQYRHPTRAALQAIAPELLAQGMEKAAEKLLNPSKRVIDAGETALENEQDSGWDSDADGNGHDYTYFINGTSGAALAVFRAMLNEWAEEQAAIRASAKQTREGKG